MAERDENPYTGEGEAPSDAGGAGEGGFDRDEVFVAPPTAEEPYVEPPEPPKWPKVVGIISTVLGGLGLVCGCLGLGSVLFSGMFTGMLEEQGPLPPTMQPGLAQSVQVVVGLVLAILLVTAGVLCINRRPVARALHLVYGVVSLIMLIFGVIVQINLINEMSQWVKNNPDSPFAQGYDPTFALIMGLGFALLFGLPWPLFCLVWFGFVKRKPADMTGGIENELI